MANYWSRRGFAVGILALESCQGLARNELSDSVAVQELNLHLHPKTLQDIFSIFMGLFRLRRAVKKNYPDIVLSFTTLVSPYVLISLVATGIPVIACESTSRAHLKNFAVRWPREVIMRLARQIIFQSASIAAEYPRSLQKLGVVIPNPLLANNELTISPRGVNNGLKVVTAIGRLVKVKDYDLLLRSFAKASKRCPDWRLEIWGDGPEYEDLLGLAQTLEINGGVELRPASLGSLVPLQRGSIFVICSRYEGFPNALCEAMAAGLAVVAVRCPGALEEIVTDQENGLLVNSRSEDALAAALLRLMTDHELRKTLGTNARSVITKYAPDIVMGQWNKLLEETVK